MATPDEDFDAINLLGRSDEHPASAHRRIRSATLRGLRFGLIIGLGVAIALASLDVLGAGMLVPLTVVAIGGAVGASYARFVP